MFCWKYKSFFSIQCFVFFFEISKTLSCWRWFLYLWCFSVSGAGRWEASCVDRLSTPSKTTIPWLHWLAEVYIRRFFGHGSEEWNRQTGGPLVGWSVGRCDFVLAIRPGKVQECFLVKICSTIYHSRWVSHGSRCTERNAWSGCVRSVTPMKYSEI